MTLREYIDQAGHGVVMRLVRESGVAASTIYDHLKSGKPLRSYPAAKKLSDATGGAVTIEDLCELPKPALPPTGTEGE